MKTKKRLIIFVILITIFSILSSIFDIKTYQNGNTIALKNIEALAYEETINPEILRICTEARGFCAHNRIQIKIVCFSWFNLLSCEYNI